ncbi:MAG: lysophospholipid acyltransferase family protein [Armatimonadota bacterium]
MNPKYNTPGVTPLGSWFLRHLFWIVMRPWNHMKVVGKENLPIGPCILAPNHISMIDPPVVSASMVDRIVTYLGKAELFEVPVVNYFIWRAGCMPVQQNSGDRRAIRNAVEMLTRGHILCLFSEGTRSPDGYLLPIQKGISMIAKMSGAPVVPAGIVGTRDALMPGDNHLYPRPVVISYGKPISFQEFSDHYQGDCDVMEAFAQRVQQGIAEQIRSLGGKPYRDE